MSRGRNARRAAQRKSPKPPAYFHGGPRGLTVGDHIKPPTELVNIPPDARLSAPLDDLDNWRFVSISTDLELAVDYAARWTYAGQQSLLKHLRTSLTTEPEAPWEKLPHSGGSVYRVEPEGELVSDPDYPEGVSYHTQRARVTEVVRPTVPFSTNGTGAALSYMTWETGEKMYTADGRAQLTSQMRALGMTQRDLDKLGYGPHVEKIYAAANAFLLQNRSPKSRNRHILKSTSTLRSSLDF